MPGRKALLAGTAALSCAALVAAPAAPAATLSAGKTKVFRSNEKLATGAAKEISKKKLKVNTKSTPVSFASGTSVGAQAACTGKTHATGGGYSVAPGFTGGSGLRSIETTNHPVDLKNWNAAGGAFTTPAASGTFTTYVRCEGNGLGRIASIVSGSATVGVGVRSQQVLNCPPGTHVISGGYAGTGLVNFTSATTGPRMFIHQSQRTATGQWTVTGTNNSNPGSSPATLTSYAVCERDGKRRTVSEVASLVMPIGNDVRSAADAACTGRRHTVSGGFLINPNAGTLPAIGIDENNPVEEKSWHVSLWEFPGFTLPVGSTLQTFAYCKKDPPKKK